MSIPMPGDLVMVKRVTIHPATKAEIDIPDYEDFPGALDARQSIGTICRVLSAEQVSNYRDGYDLEHFETKGYIYIEIDNGKDWWPVHPDFVEVVFSV